MRNGAGPASARSEAVTNGKQPVARTRARLPGRAAKGALAPLKVCVVTSEILGPVKNGGIGTATSALIAELTSSGHDVTILYTLVQGGEPECAEASWAHWVEQNARIGARLIHIPHDGEYGNWLTKSWLVKKHLEAGDYNVVYFNEHHGSGYYALAAKRAGISPFTSQVHCVITHGSIEWVVNINDQRITRTSDLQMIGLERRSVEWADVVISPSQYLLREYESYGWALPRQSYVQPYPFQPGEASRSETARPVDEIVFFGRLETRKGLWLFCEALDLMGDALRGRKVTFMGRPTDVDGVPSPIHILSRAEKWPCAVELLLNYSQEQALDYLGQGNRVAVMPSIADNSPCVVYECMQKSIPFVTTSGSGAEELIHKDCWPHVIAEPSAASLAGRLRGVLDKGAGTAEPSFAASGNLAEWKGWGRRLADAASRAEVLAAAAPEPAGKPAAAGKSVFLFIDDREMPIGRTLDLLHRQLEGYGPIGDFALLTVRQDPLRPLIEGALQAKADQHGSKVSVLTPAALPAFLKACGKKGITLFVTDVGNEFLGTFVEAARRILNGRLAVAVSCVLATRQDEQDRPVIAELPVGDLPAAGPLGMPIASPAWAVLGESLAGVLEAADLHDAVLGETTAAQDAGSLLFHKLQIAGKPIRLIPAVGAIRTAGKNRPRRRRHWYLSSVLHAGAMGIAPSVNKGGAAWLAVSTFSDRTPAQANDLTLPGWNPAQEAVSSSAGTLQLARLAAAHGRASQAAQIAAAADTVIDAEGLMEIAVQTARARPPIDLRMLLSGKLSIESAAPAVLALRHTAYNLSIAPGERDVLLSCTDGELQGASFTFFDVAFEGHVNLGLSCRAVACTACEVNVLVIDQASGGMMAEESRTASQDRDLVIDIPLRGISGLFCVAVELSPAGRQGGGLRLGRLRIE